MVSRIEPPKPKRSDDPVVARGQDAWERLQEDAPRRRTLSRGPGDKAIERHGKSQSEHRRWWCEVGEALAAGKRATKTSHEYYAWLKANDLDDIPRAARASAIWLMANIESLGALPDGIASPGTIRQWAYKRTALANVSNTHTVEPGASDSQGDLEVPTPPIGTRNTQEHDTGNSFDMQRAADLLLEASLHMLRSVDLIHEFIRVIRHSTPGPEEYEAASSTERMR